MDKKFILGPSLCFALQCKKASVSLNCKALFPSVQIVSMQSSLFIAMIRRMGELEFKLAMTSRTDFDNIFLN